LLSGIFAGGCGARQTNPRSWAKIVLPNMILRSAVPHIPTAFEQLVKLLDRRSIARAVAAHDGDRGVGTGENAWGCERHLKALLFAQVARLSSLRHLVEGMAPHSRRFYHLNLRQPCRSTLSDANRERPAAVFRDIALGLIPLAAGTLRQHSEALVRLLDATPIPLKGRRFGWAEANARTRGLKLHLLHDPRQGRPVWFDVTSAKVDDVVAGRAVPLEPGATYVFDKGYTDYRWWSQIIEAGAFFVTRSKRNVHRREQADRPAVGAGILADRQLGIGHRQARGGAPHNRLWQVPLREIVVARPEPEAPLYLLTNQLTRPAPEIARLYKERWQIELLFKWLKQNLKIRSFLGRSENAVRLQIYVALIAFLLLRMLHHTAARSFKDSTGRLLARLQTAWFNPLSLSPRATPPPRPPNRRTPNPQACFAFR
jgi:putative transposase